MMLFMEWSNEIFATYMQHYYRKNDIGRCDKCNFLTAVYPEVDESWGKHCINPNCPGKVYPDYRTKYEDLHSIKLASINANFITNHVCIRDDFDIDDCFDEVEWEPLFEMQFTIKFPGTLIFELFWTEDRDMELHDPLQTQMIFFDEDLVIKKGVLL